MGSQKEMCIDEPEVVMGKDLQEWAVLSVERTFSHAEMVYMTFKELMDGLDALGQSDAFGALTPEQRAYVRGYKACRLDSLYRYCLMFRPMVDGKVVLNEEEARIQGGSEPFEGLYVWRKEPRRIFG